jgi:hypothetical protein
MMPFRPIFLCRISQAVFFYALLAVLGRDVVAGDDRIPAFSGVQTEDLGSRKDARVPLYSGAKSLAEYAAEVEANHGKAFMPTRKGYGGQVASPGKLPATPRNAFDPDAYLYESEVSTRKPIPPTTQRTTSSSEGGMVIGGPMGGSIMPGSGGGMIIGGPLGGSILPGSKGGMVVGGPLGGSIMPDSKGGMIIGGPLNGSIMPGSRGGMVIGGPIGGSIMPDSKGGMIIGGPMGGSILPPTQ